MPGDARPVVRTGLTIGMDDHFDLVDMTDHDGETMVGYRETVG